MIRNWKSFLVLPILSFLVLMTLFGLVEYWQIAIVANPEIIEEYRFGAESMISHGGEKYRSANTYANALLQFGLISLIGLVISVITLLKSKSRKILKTYFVGISTAIILYASV